MLREQMIQMKPELAEKLPVESVIIASLLHDVCKSNIYKDAILNRKNDQGYWEKVIGYEVDYSSLPLGHGEKSNLQMARDTAPLCTIIQAADGLSSALLED